MLLGFQVPDLLVDLHLFLVVSRLVLNSFVEEKTELIGLMDTVNKHCEEGHFLMIGEVGSEISWLDAYKLLLDGVHLILERPEYVRVLALRILEDHAHNLWP